MLIKLKRPIEVRGMRHEELRLPDRLRAGHLMDMEEPSKGANGQMVQVLVALTGLSLTEIRALDAEDFSAAATAASDFLSAQTSSHGEVSTGKTG